MMNNYYFADSIKVTICRSRLHIYETPFKASVFSLRILSVESTVSYVTILMVRLHCTKDISSANGQ